MARSVLSGAGILAVSGVATKLFGIVSSPVLTRLVGPAPYGVVALAGTVSSLAATVGLLGVDLAYARHFFATEGEERNAVERFCWRFATCAGFLVAVLAGVGWVVLRRADGAALPLFVAGGALAAVFLPLATTRQRLRGLYGRIAAASIRGGALGVFAAITLAWGWRPDARAMLLGGLAGAAVTIGVVGLPPVKTLLQTSGLSRARRGEILRMGMSGVVTASMFWLMNSADRWLLGEWFGESTVGVYSFAAGIGTTGILVNSAMTLAWFPEMAREYAEAGDDASVAIGRLWGVLAGVLMVTWLAVSAAGGDAIRLLADRRFHDGAYLVPWIAGGVFFYGLASLANTGLILRMTMAPAAAWWAVGATLNVAANVVLVPRFGAGGAAVAACLAYGVVAAGTIRSAQRRHRLPIPWGRLGIAAMLTLAASAAMVRPWSASPVASLAWKFPMGAVAAIAILRLTEPSWFAKLLRIGRGGWKTGI
jgi:O-antigen/teichoic acid export membrane protein